MQGLGVSRSMASYSSAVTNIGLIDRLVEQVRSGHPAVALIEGPAGIGNSRLLLATGERARAAGFRTLAARGSDLERGPRFGVVRQDVIRIRRRAPPRTASGRRPQRTHRVRPAFRRRAEHEQEH